MATAAIKPRAEAACRLCQGEAVKTKGQWLIARKNLGLFREPQILLVYKFVLFRSETRKDRAIAVAPFGYDLENLKIWLKIIFHCRIVF